MSYNELTNIIEERNDRSLIETNVTNAMLHRNLVFSKISYLENLNFPFDIGTMEKCFQIKLGIKNYDFFLSFMNYPTRKH